MAIINQSNILNLQPGITAPVVVHMSEGDVGTKLSFKLIDGANAWTDPGNVVAAVHGRRQDGTQFGPYACSISGDVVSFKADAAIAARAGAGLAEIVLTDSTGATAGSANFAIMVERATFPTGVTYTNDVSVYEAILAYVQTIPAAVTEDYTTKIAAEAAARIAANTQLSADVSTIQDMLTEEIQERTQQDEVLSARMDEFARLPDGSLSTTADAELVDIRVKANGKTASTAGDAVREQIDGVYTNVSQMKTESGLIYEVTSTNLFNYADCELGNIKADGTEEDSTTIMRTKNYVPIADAAYIVANYPMRRFFYDETLNFVLRSASTADAIEVPSNAKYVRFLLAKATYDAHTDIVANAGETVIDYVPFELKGTLLESVVKASDTVQQMEDDISVAGRNIEQMKFESGKVYTVTSTNLFDYANCELGDISSTGAETSSSTIMRTTEYVPIKDADYISVSIAMRRVFYDSEFEFISRTASTINTMEVPSNAAYIRFTISKASYDSHPTDIMANIGSTRLPYEPFDLSGKLSSETVEYALANSASYTAHKFYDQLYKVFKRVGVCGDSMSVGYTRNPVTEETLTRNLPYSWVKCVGRDAHTYWLNFGTTGQNVLTWCSSATYGKVQMEAENNKCQAYIIGLGVNDVNDVPIGTAADIVDDPDTVATTYYGGYARIIQLIKRRNADAKIFCFTNPRENSAEKPFNDAVRYIAGTYYTTTDNVFLVDLYKDYGYLFAAGMPLYIDKQAVSHYSSVGYQMLSKINEEAISMVMLENQLSFLTVPFIPYDTAEPTPDTMTE